MSEIKISAAVGSASFSYEGEAQLLESKLGVIFERLQELAKQAPILKAEAGPNRKSPEDTSSVHSGTINTLIAKVGGASCSEVLKAAATHISLVQGKDRFSSTEWDALAKEANSWKSDYANQKATVKKRLVNSGFVIENAKDIYSLSSDARKQMEEKIA
jgi:hypothetical protein